MTTDTHVPFGRRLRQADRKIFLYLNGSFHSRPLDMVMVVLTQFGNAWVVIPLLAVILFLAEGAWISHRFIVIATALALGGILGNITKNVIKRKRPLSVFKDGIDNGTVYVHTVIERAKHKSFPSGHAQTVLGTFVAVTWYWAGWYTPLLLVWALVVSFSRIYLGIHFPLDVAGGAVLGIVIALIICTTAMLYGFA
jgi:undecaprenyl-diphosphatase